MNKQTKVGIFVALGLLVLTAIVFSIGDNRSTFERKVTYLATFYDAAGLKSGAPVRMGGVDVGTVIKVAHAEDVSDERIHVTMSIVKREAQRIHVDTVAHIVNKGLLGDKMVELSTGGRGAEAFPGATLGSEEPVDLGKYLTQLDVIAKKTESAVSNVDRLTQSLAGDPRFADDVKGSAASLREILDGVAHKDGAAHRLIFDAEEGKRIDRTLANLERVSETFAEVSDHVKTGPGLAHAVIYDSEMSASLGGALVELHKDLQAIREGNGIAHALIYGDKDSQRVMGNMNAMSDDLRQIIANIKAGKGTIGGLLVDPSIYEDVKSIVGNVDRNQVLRSLVRYSIKQDEASKAQPQK
jgi:phospholipid/cholesterol/gamma-HCH transport system substrate-binding protein